jgi:hypothetical protein
MVSFALGNWYIVFCVKENDMKFFLIILSVIVACDAVGMPANQQLKKATKYNIEKSLTQFISHGSSMAKLKIKNGMLILLERMKEELISDSIRLESFELADKKMDYIAKNDLYKKLYNEAFQLSKKFKTLNPTDASEREKADDKIDKAWHAFRKQGAQLLRDYSINNFKIMFPNGNTKEERDKFFAKYCLIGGEIAIVRVQAAIIAVHRLREKQEEAIGSITPSIK